MINRTHAFIDTNALQHNLQRVQQIAPNMPIIAMVKANAYGHGVEQIAHGLALKVAGFGVACLSEARQLKKALTFSITELRFTTALWTGTQQILNRFPEGYGGRETSLRMFG